jgi:arabinogalactan endo-1,4-beta-galactosidase
LYRYDFEGLKERDLKVQIRGLKMYGINNKLILRMLTNMDIIKAEKKRREKKYKEKDAAVKSIKYTYKLIELSNSDYLSLAQFLTYYDNVESSKALLYPVVSKVDANEDLLFYYINQTIVSNTMVAQNDYRVILSNAYGQNPERFCQLFNASTKEGVTFQLLKNTYLRSSFCENCN